MEFNKNSPGVLVVDNFYVNPAAVRELALQQQFVASPDYYKGKRSQRFLFPWVREEFQKLLGREIKSWMQYDTNGCFQITGAENERVWHSDSQDYAAAVYLTPDAPLNAGTCFWQSKQTGLRAAPTQADADRTGLSLQELEMQTYGGKLLSQDGWDLVSYVGNVYNRLVIWNARQIHSAGEYFGSCDKPETARLAQLYFFDVV